MNQKNSSQKIKFHNVQMSINSAWTLVVIAASFNMFGSSMELLNSQQIPMAPQWPAVASASIAFVCLILLVVFKKTQSSALAPTIYLVNSLAFLALHMIKYPYYAEYAVSWAPFQASKMACLFAALIAPRYWIGLLMIGLHLTAVPLQYFNFSPAAQAKLALGEPWIIVAFAIAGIFTLTHRYRGLALEQKNSDLQADQIAGKKLAGAFLQVRDMMNTPLQIIELAVTMIRSPATDYAKVLPKLERAATDLKLINAELSRYESEFDWKQEHETLNKERSEKYLN